MADHSATVEKVAEAWGGLAQPPRLIGLRENAVYEIQLKTMKRAALRLHRVGYHSEQTITSELIWTETLATGGFPCPRPIRSMFDELTAQTENGQFASAVTWIDAKPIGANGQSFEGTVSQQVEIYHQLGALTRRLHDLTVQMDPRPLSRPRWDCDALLGEDPHWGRFWDNPALDEPEVATLQTARRLARQQLTANKALETHLIHADLLQENVLQNAQGLHIIDFDDGGFGYPLYDLGTALVQHTEHPELAALTDAICAGYGCDTDLIPLYMMLRTFASCGWVISRLPADDPRHRFYADRALHCARDYLKT